MPPKKAAASKDVAAADTKASTTTSTRPTRAPKAKATTQAAAPAKPEIQKTTTALTKKVTVPKQATTVNGTKRKASAVGSDEEEDETPKMKKPKAATLKNDDNEKPATKNAPVSKAAPASKVEKKVAPLKKSAATKKTPASKAAPASKVTKEAATAKRVPAPEKTKKALPQINTRPTQKLDIFVFGEGTAGELGLGGYKYDGNKKPIDVARPRLNTRLSANDIGVVQMAVGGMHCVALTHDNKIFTWGVNDMGALGRKTGAGKVVEIGAKETSDNSDSDSEDEDEEYLNPSESEPREVNQKHFPAGTQFAKVAASDSASFAITTEGFVYGWGGFRGTDGPMPFRPHAPIHSAVEMEEYEGQDRDAYKKRMAEKNSQFSPILISELKKIVDIECGSNHVLALDDKGKVFVWGAGEQNQLGRRVVARTANGALIPREFGLQRKKITKIGSGEFHSFAVDKDNNFYAWGHNPFGQTGIPTSENQDDTIPTATLVKSLNGYKIKQVTGGVGHTIACTESGQVLVWGRIDNKQGGMDVSKFSEEDVFTDEDGRRRYLNKPVALPNLDGETVAAATDNCLVVCKDGKAYSWGFSANYQTGQGTTNDVVDVTHINNTAVRGKQLVYCGAGGQFSVLAGIHEDVVMNGA